jgi:hypothetical protein
VLSNGEWEPPCCDPSKVFAAFEASSASRPFSFTYRMQRSYAGTVRAEVYVLTVGPELQIDDAVVRIT